MKRKILKKKTAVRKLGKVLGISLAVSAAAGLIILLFSWADKHDRQAELRQKECWKKIYAIVERNREKADWIKLTVSNHASFLEGVDYCKVLDLIENGQEKKEE